MFGAVWKDTGERSCSNIGLMVTTACFLSFAGDMRPAVAQTAPTAEEVRLVEFGKEIFKSKAVCQYCHKWDASGDQGYGGNGMPYHDRFAYTDKRCYGQTREEMGKDMPPAGNDFLSQREVDAVVKYLFAKAVGRGPATYEDCVDFWGTNTRQCDPMKQ